MKKILLALAIFIGVLLLSAFLYFQLSACGIAPWSCGDYSSGQTGNTHKIQVGSGPEDMAIDTSTGSSRIIVSCVERRKKAEESWGFYQIYPASNSSRPLKVLPEGLRIFPHGIDVETIDGIPYLYAISHDRLDNAIEHRIYRFHIMEDTLVLDDSFTLEHPSLTGPNDIDVLEDGSFYVSNPMPSDNPNETAKAIVGVKNGSVLHYDGQGNWKTVLDDMCYPNGVWVNREASCLVVANGGCQTVERYPIQENGELIVHEGSSTREHGIDIPIGDNLMMDESGILWTAAHPCPLKFLSHAKHSHKSSPVQIFAIDPVTMKTHLVFQNNGDLINAASTALRIDDRLYISQVFDPFVLVVEGIDL
ncbi:MAG: SMP-30/gluconolactonase/LRE family protein [Bacteroidota bacterium]